VYSDPDGVARAAAQEFVEHARRFIASEGMFAVALAGGNTPRRMYRVLAAPEYSAHVGWSKVQVFWGDERTVPPDHPDSNYGMARGELLERVPIPKANLHRMEAEREDLGRAAQEYEGILRDYLAFDARGFPGFHLILLGLGVEGHTASLFSGSGGLQGTSRWVSTPLVQELGTRRMTLTLPVLNAAHQVLFLVTGAEKAPSLRDVLAGKSEPPLPAQQVTVPRGRRTFLADAAAASLVAPEDAKPEEKR
jgi:6-phosphogluconolactonase